MTVASTTINREAGDKAKGPRLQRLRCVYLVFEALEKSSNPHIYGAVEYKEDVIIKDISNDTDYLEQNKNYASTSTFTFNSPEVINTMIGYCDIWVEYGVKSKDVFLGFYSTNKIGKENKTNLIKELTIELPDKPILELLQDKKYDYIGLLPCIKALVIEEYKKQYSGRKSDGNLSSIEAFTDEDWTTFLKAIDWKFGELNETELKCAVLDKIKASRFYNHTHNGNEESILRNIMDLLDERQCYTDSMGKFVHAADIELIFLKASAISPIQKSEDPVYKLWNSLPNPTDKRTITDKIKAVCPIFLDRKIKQYARKTASGRILMDETNGDKNFLSLRYRIFDKCESELTTYLNKHSETQLNTEDEVEKLFGHLYTVAKDHITSLTKDFKYSFKSEVVIEEIILELFDSCYLAMN